MTLADLCDTLLSGKSVVYELHGTGAEAKVTRPGQPCRAVTIRKARELGEFTLHSLIDATGYSYDHCRKTLAFLRATQLVEYVREVQLGTGHWLKVWRFR